MEYRKEDFLIISNLEIRTLKEDDNDIDLFIPIDYRTLNLYIENLPNYINNRIQFTEVRSLIIRFSIKEDENYCTIHLLKSIDLQSAIVNFEMNYKDHYIELVHKEYYIEMYLKRKES